MNIGVFFLSFLLVGFVRVFWEFWRDGCSDGDGRRGCGGVVIECRLVKLLWWWIFVWVRIRMWWQNIISGVVFSCFKSIFRKN